MWPITDDMLDRIDVEGSKKRKKYLAYMRHVIDGAPLSKRYLFYSLIQNEKVEISWISTQDEKEIAYSPYLQLLQKLFMIPVEKKDHQDPDMFKIDDLTSRERIGTLSTSFETINTQEGLLDLMLCPWRYIYGLSLIHIWEPSKTKQWAHDCYVKHFGDVDEFTGIDIAAVDKNHIPEHNLLVGGFPCQDYSVARPLTGSTGLEGKKGVLWWQIRDVLVAKHTPFVLLENVDRLLKSPATQRAVSYTHLGY